MTFRMFVISSMYNGYLDHFYSKHPEAEHLSYNEHLNLLLNETTEFVGSYWRAFRKLGIEPGCIIANDDKLRHKWESEHRASKMKPEDYFFEQVRVFRPDVLWIENLSFVTPEGLDYLRENVRSIRLIAGYHCSPYGSNIINCLRKTDLLVTCTPGIKKAMEDQGIKTYLIYHGFDDSVLPKLVPFSETAGDSLVFSGSLIAGGDFHSERISLIEKLLSENINIDLYVNIEKWHRIKAKQSIFLINRMLKNLKVKIPPERFSFLKYGNEPVKNYSKKLLSAIHDPVYGMAMYNLFSSAGIVLNYHIGVAGDYAGNMRLFEATGVGSCLLTDYKKNISELFDPDNEIVVYRDAADCIEKARWLLSNESDRRRIASNGQKRTLQAHKVEDRCRSVIDILSENLKRFS